MNKTLKIKPILLSQLKGLKKFLPFLEALGGIDVKAQTILDDELHDIIVYVGLLDDELKVKETENLHSDLRLTGW